MTASIAAVRVETALRHALGQEVAGLLDDPATTDVMLNESGKIFCDQLGRGRFDTGYTMSAADARTALSLLAHHCGSPLTRQAPLLSGVLPGSGERVAGTIPPITCAPTFAVRVPPRRVFGLDAFSGEVSESFSQETAVRRIAEAGTNMGALLRAVEERRNILIVGGTGSGKTSLLSSLLQTESIRRDRVIAIEDTQELALDAIPDHARLLTSPEIDMKALLQLSLRMRPDRIIVGEFRSGPAVMAWLHACNTGHSGSFGTIHGNSCQDALGRVEDLANEVCMQPPTRSIRCAIECIVFVTRTARGRAIKEVMVI